MSLEIHNFEWALSHINKGKAVSRDHREWAGKKLVKINRQTITVDKKSPYHSHSQGQVIVMEHLVTIRENLIANFSDPASLMAEDWKVV